MKQKENKILDNILPLHIALTNNSSYTSDAIRVALSRMDEAKIGVRVSEIEEQPFVRHLVNYLYQFKIDLLLIDMQLEGQNTSLYLEKIKNIDKDIKVILLSQFITPEVIRLQNMKIIDEYISLPFQDANLWDAIYRIYNATEVSHIEIPTNSKPSLTTQDGHKPISVYERNKNKHTPLTKTEIIFELEDENEESEDLLINLDDVGEGTIDSENEDVSSEEKSEYSKLNIEEEENIIFEDMWETDNDSEMREDEETENEKDIEDERLNDELNEMEEDFRLFEEDEVFEL